MFPAPCSARAKNCSKGCHVTVRVGPAGCGLLLLIPAAEWHCLLSPWAHQQRLIYSLHLLRQFTPQTLHAVMRKLGTRLS